MNYKIKYNTFYGGNKYEFENKVIFFIGPNSPKNILSNLPDDVDYVICVSGNPGYSIDHYGLKKNNIIFSCLLPTDNHTIDKMKQVINKGIILRTNKKLFDVHDGRKIFVNDLKNKITFTHPSIFENINKILKDIKYNRWWPSTGFFCLIDIFLQNPKKVYVNGITWFHPKFSYYDGNDNDYMIKRELIQNLIDKWPDNLPHDLKEEYRYLKKNYLLKSNVILDDNIKWILNNDNILN